jgi:hypothetical protein
VEQQEAGRRDHGRWVITAAAAAARDYYLQHGVLSVMAQRARLIGQQIRRRHGDVQPRATQRKAIKMLLPAQRPAVNHSDRLEQAVAVLKAAIQCGYRIGSLSVNQDQVDKSVAVCGREA